MFSSKSRLKHLADHYRSVWFTRWRWIKGETGSVIRENRNLGDHSIYPGTPWMAFPVDRLCFQYSRRSHWPCSISENHVVCRWLHPESQRHYGTQVGRITWDSIRCYWSSGQDMPVVPMLNADGCTRHLSKRLFQGRWRDGCFRFYKPPWSDRLKGRYWSCRTS